MPFSNILDPPQPTLPPHVWEHPDQPEPTLRPVHAHFITKHIYGILEAGGYPDPHQWLNLYLTGSLCTYQYSDDSDADVSLFVDSHNLPEWSRAEMIGLMIEGCDGVTLPGTTYELQAYVVGKGIHPADLYKPGLRAGYDIGQNKWIQPPDRNLIHDAEAQENGFYVWALQAADKMERLLRYEPDKAVDYWHQIHRKRIKAQIMGKGDYSESNILYKFLAKRGLLPQISQASGEYIASLDNPAIVDDDAYPRAQTRAQTSHARRQRSHSGSGPHDRGRGERVRYLRSPDGGRGRYSLRPRYSVFSPVNVQAEPDRWHRAFDAAAGAQGERALSVTRPEPEELAARRGVFLGDQDLSGYTISPEGEIANVFRHPIAPRGVMREVVQHAVPNGGRWLNAYDGGLTNHYRRLGFTEQARIPFVDEYAPEGWDVNVRGRPDIVFMTHGVPENPGRYFDDYDEAAQAAQRASLGG